MPAGQIQTCYGGLLMFLLFVISITGNMHVCNVFRGAHCWPHHCSKGVYGFINDNVLPCIMVNVSPKAAGNAGNPGWCSNKLHSCLFDECLSCKERTDHNFNRSDFSVKMKNSTDKNINLTASHMQVQTLTKES